MSDRETAIKWAKVDWSSAVECAREIAEPRYRCQSLGWIARYAPEDMVGRLAIEAFDSAVEATDRHQTVGGAAWPVRALIERNLVSEASALIQQALPFEREIPYPGSQADALELLFQAAFPGGEQIWSDVLNRINTQEPDMAHWRRTRALRDGILMMQAVDASLAARWLERVNDVKARAQAARAISSGKVDYPRSFFW